MEKVKTSKRKVVAIVLVSILIVGAVSGILIWLLNRLKYDYELGAIALERVETAQYVPDVSKYNDGAVVLSSNRLGEPAGHTGLTEEQFNEVVNEYSTICNYAGAGKYQGYDIFEIKNEIAFVVEKVPAFNQWFRMPTMRAKQGFAEIPYYESWAYYLEMGEDNVLSITRVSYCTRSRYLDFENQKTIEYYDDETSFSQYEVMKINYYVDENNKEVVECYVYSVGIDKTDYFKGFYNSNTEDYYPFEYLYLKNVKDTYLVKYHITAAERYSDTESFDQGGMDITGEHPYGSHREFTILSYDGYSNMHLTEIEQQLPTRLISTNTLIGLTLGDSNLELLNETVDLSNDELLEITTEEQYLDAVCKKIVDNFEIKNNWPEIYKNQVKAVKVKMTGPCTRPVILEYVDGYADVDKNNASVGFDFDADVVEDLNILDINKEYSLSLALTERSTGEIIIIATDYKKLEEAYKGGDSRFPYFRTSSVYGISLSEFLVYNDYSHFKLEKDGVYDFLLVLTEKVNNEDVILFNTHCVPFLMHTVGKIALPDRVDSNGVTHHYEANATGGKITITVTSDTE